MYITYRDFLVLMRTQSDLDYKPHFNHICSTLIYRLQELYLPPFMANLKSPINLTRMPLGCGREPVYPEETHTYTCYIHTDRLSPTWRFGPLALVVQSNKEQQGNRSYMQQPIVQLPLRLKNGGLCTEITAHEPPVEDRGLHFHYVS